VVVDRSRPRVWWRAGGAAAAFLVGLLIVTSATTAGGEDLRSSRDTLPALVAADRDRLADAAAQAAVLRRATATTGATAATAGSRGQEGAGPRPAQAGAGPLPAAVGLTPVHGPAVTVVLDDAPRESRGGPLPPGVRPPGPDDLVVHQQDVQAVVNALWAGSAEAMTIMGRRVIGRTAVRCVGNTLLLQGEVFSPPFQISAIGDTRGMTAALDAEPGVTLYREYVDAYRLGYRVEVTLDARFPGYRGSVRLPSATPIG
jgi:uncharacterized protein YlxW (UPF0749 family)